MIDRYPQLVEAVVEFRRYMRKYIHDTTAELRKYQTFPDLSIEGVPYVEAQSARETDLAEGYR
jgi:hypothetical protein